MCRPNRSEFTWKSPYSYKISWCTFLQSNLYVLSICIIAVLEKFSVSPALKFSPVTTIHVRALSCTSSTKKHGMNSLCSSQIKHGRPGKWSGLSNVTRENVWESQEWNLDPTVTLGCRAQFLYLCCLAYLSGSANPNESKCSFICFTAFLHFANEM